MSEPTIGRIDNDSIIFLALIKDGGERYIWLYRESEKAEVIRSFGRFAANPELSFTWYDAARLSQKMRESSPQ